MSIDIRLNYHDIMWLIEAANAWEEKESHEFYFAKEILSIPEMDEDAAMNAGIPPEALNFIEALKRKYRGKEQSLADKKDGVAEKAATMKAILYRLKRELGTNMVFNVEASTIETPDGEYKFDVSKKPHPLEAQLKAAIRAEDYDEAARIRDELKKVHKNESQDD